MARPLKDGVDYFPKDTDFYADDKIRLLRAEFGAKGMYLLDYILCDLYSKNGYFIKWDKNKCYLVSDGAGCGCNPEFVAEFISGCIRCSFFDEGVFNMFGVLTSAGIQRRFIRMLNSRENFTFIDEYFLLDTSDKKDVPAGILNKIAFKKVSNKENPVKSKENPDKNIDNSQSKVEENKGDKNIKDTPRSTPPTKKNPLLVTIEEYTDNVELREALCEFAKMRKTIKKPLTERALSLTLNKLESYADNELTKIQILNQSIMNSWQGVFPLKNNTGGNYGTNRQNNGDDYAGTVWSGE